MPEPRRSINFKHLVGMVTPSLMCGADCVQKVCADADGLQFLQWNCEGGGASPDRVTQTNGLNDEPALLRIRPGHEIEVPIVKGASTS